MTVSTTPSEPARRSSSWVRRLSPWPSVVGALTPAMDAYDQLVVFRRISTASSRADPSVLTGRQVYDPIPGVLPFNYPPFGAVAMVPLALVGLGTAEVLWTLLSLAAYAVLVIVIGRRLSLGVAVIITVAVRRPGARTARSPPCAGSSQPRTCRACRPRSLRRPRAVSRDPGGRRRGGETDPSGVRRVLPPQTGLGGCRAIVRHLCRDHRPWMVGGTPPPRLATGWRTSTRRRGSARTR